MKPTASAEAERFLRLFVPNPRSTGRFDPATGRMHTDYEEVTLSDVDRHLRGAFGFGAVPILDDDTCKWAAIDIDNHGQDEDIPIKPVDEKVIAGNLPLVLCRSKSGGIHAYVFFETAVPASRARSLLTGWARQIGYGEAEIFPKQSKLAVDRTGKRQLGNWINLPYLGGDQTVRYAYRNGRKLSLEEFLALAEKSRVGADRLDAAVLLEHPQAPPCIQHLLVKGVAAGQRNEGMYNTVVYLRKLDPEGYADRAAILNGTMFAKPLPKAELNRTINSAGRPDYKYRCGEEPIKSVCDRDTCLKRKYGITPEDSALVDALAGLPTFSSVTKIMSDPVRWEIAIDGIRVSNIGTEDLLDWKFMRKLIAERLTKVVPLIKNQEWERILAPLMTQALILEAPDDASVPGLIRQRLREFGAKAMNLHGNKSVDDRMALTRGLPILAPIDGVKCVVFRAQDFVNYLKRTKSEELRGVNLWMAARELGVSHRKMRVGDTNINVWHFPYQDPDRTEKPTIRAEL